MAKKRKKYNKLKSIQSMSRVLTRDKWVLFCAGEKYQLACPKKLKLYGSSQTERDAYSKIRYKWSVLAAALCIDNFGKPYIKSIQLDFQEEYLHEEIQSLCADKLIELVETCNKNQFKTLGFLMSTKPTDFNEEIALTLFEKAKCFEHTVEIREVENEH